MEQFLPDQTATYRRLKALDTTSYKTLKSNKEFMGKVAESHDKAMTFMVREGGFSEAKCPNCSCLTIQNVVDPVSNQFIPECLHCKLRFEWKV